MLLLMLLFIDQLQQFLMAKKAWFDDEHIDNQQPHLFIPLDVESPLIIHPTPSEELARLGQICQTQKSRFDPPRIQPNYLKLKSWNRAKRGMQRETANLSKFVFAFLKRLLSDQYQMRRLSHEAMEAAREFLNARGKLTSYEYLNQCQQLREVVRGQLQSSRVVKQIMQSQMIFANKVRTVRFLESIRRVCHSRVPRWKE